MNDLISLIVPIYNGEKYLSHFFECIFKQTYINIEVIVVDDGSSDKTYEVCKTFEQDHNNVYVYKKQNGGPSSARNYGVNYAKGKYVGFVDVDDIIFPTYVEYLYETIQIDDSDIAFCNYVKCTEKLNYTRYLKNERNKDTYICYTQKRAIEDFCYRKNLTGYSSLKLIKTELLKGKLKFLENIVYGEDYVFSYNLLKHCKKIAYGSAIQYVYVQWKQSETHKLRDNTLKYYKTWIEYIKILKDIENSFPSAYMGCIDKIYISAINNVFRIYDYKRDYKIVNEYYDFIDKHAKGVWKNPKCKIRSRILGLLGIISPRLVCDLCAFIMKMQNKFGWTFKRIN